MQLQLTVNQPGIYYLIAKKNEKCYGKSQEIGITELPACEVQVFFNEGSLSAIAENVTYQWFNCDMQEPVAGDNAANFTPTLARTFDDKVSRRIVSKLLIS